MPLGGSNNDVENIGTGAPSSPYTLRPENSNESGTSREYSETNNTPLQERTDGITTCPSPHDYALSKSDGDMTFHDQLQVEHDSNHIELTESRFEKLSFWNQMRYRAQIVHNHHFQNMVVVLIIINSITMGLETFEFVTQNKSLVFVFDTIDSLFLIFFTLELSLEFVHHGMKLFNYGWLVLDFTVISLSWLFSSLAVIRAFRIFRALRIITHMNDLKELVTVLLSVLPRIAYIGMLLLLVFYIFAVMFTQLFQDLYVNGYTSADNFSSLGKTFFTLFQLMTLDSWSTICREVMEVHTWSWFPIVSFVLISAFTVVNMIIAVICDAVGDLHRQKTMEAVVEVKESMTFNTDDFHHLQNDIMILTQQVSELLRVNQSMQMQLNRLSSTQSVSSVDERKKDC